MTSYSWSTETVSFEPSGELKGTSEECAALFGPGDYDASIGPDGSLECAMMTTEITGGVFPVVDNTDMIITETTEVVMTGGDSTVVDNTNMIITEGDLVTTEVVMTGGE